MDFITLYEKVIDIFSMTNTAVSLWIVSLIALGIYLILFILEGIGLYGMAEKQGADHKWQAFVPFANTYLIGRLAEESYFCGKKIKKIKVWLLLSEIVSFLMSASWLVFYLLACFTDVFASVRYITTETIYGIEVQSIHFTNELEIFNNVMPYVSQLFHLIYWVFFIVALINLFRKYSARNGASITLWCVFAEVFFGVPIHGIFMYAMRNNKPVDYNEYIRKKQAEYMNQQRYRNPYDYYGNDANRSNASRGYNYDPYTGQPIRHDSGNSSEKPFSEFGTDEKGNQNDENEPFSFR